MPFVIGNVAYFGEVIKVGKEDKKTRTYNLKKKEEEEYFRILIT